MQVLKLTAFTIFALLLAVSMVGCNADQTRKAGEAQEKVAEQTERAAGIIRTGADLGDQAPDFLNNPVNQLVLSWLPDDIQGRVEAILLSGEDIGGKLREVADELGVAAAANRAQAQRLYEQAQSNESKTANLLAIIAAAVTGGGAFGGVIGRLIGLARGASEVARVIQTGRDKDPQLDQAFQGVGGDKMAIALAQAPATVRKAVVRVKDGG